MKCQKHDCEMTEIKPPGWGSKGKMVCAECEAEQVQVRIRQAASGQLTETVRKREAPRRGGWQ